jgi:Bacteriophage T4-like portal protein (Gp20)
MAKLFGFSIDDEEKKSKGIVSPVPPNDEDGADYYLSSGFYGQYVDIEGVFRTEFDIIKKYRDMALHPECDTAIEHVVNEAIVSDLNDSPVEIDLDNLQVSTSLKKVIRNEFKYVKDLLEFDKKSHEIFRNWYVDGRIYYHKVIDLQKPDEGIKEVRYIDALKMKLMRVRPNDKKALPARPYNEDVTSTKDADVVEFYTYYPEGVAQKYGSVSGKGIKIAKDAICHVTSGLVDRNKHLNLSYLHKAIKALNQLRMIEDSLVIYRLSRAPERRIFYIDVGNLPKVKAEQYLRDVMSRYRNKLVYDASTGEIKDDKKFMSMLEDFWLPRREGGRGTEISTLPGGQNLGELTDVEYFQKKLYRSLNVPDSRIGSDSGFNLGRSSEILRDELMFSKFVGRLRKRFSGLFLDLLKTQLILKNIVTPEDWEQMAEHIQFDYLYDNHFAELKDTELMNERLNLMVAIEPYIGTYYSRDYVKRKVLRQTDEEIMEMEEEMESENEMGIGVPLETQNAIMQGQMQNDLGMRQTEPDLDKKKDGGSTEAPPINIKKAKI